MCGIWQLRAVTTGAGAFFAAAFDEPFGTGDLVPLQLARLVGLLQHVAEVFVIVLRTGDLESRRQRNSPVLDRLDQALLAFFQKEDDVADIFFGEAGALNDIVDAIIPRQQQLDVG